MEQTWHALSLGDALLAGAELERIVQLFHSSYTDHNKAYDLALFIRHESEHHLHCDVIVYFPPATAMLARQLGARPCSAPGQQDLGLLVGEESAWTACLPAQPPDSTRA